MDSILLKYGQPLEVVILIIIILAGKSVLHMI